MEFKDLEFLYITGKAFILRVGEVENRYKFDNGKLFYQDTKTYEWVPSFNSLDYFISAELVCVFDEIQLKRRIIPSIDSED